MEVLQSLTGLATITAFAWVISERRAAISWKVVGIGLAVQFLLAIALLKIEFFQSVFAILNVGVIAVADATRAGTSFVFGYVGGGDAPFIAKDGGGSSFVLAFESLPLILVISALSALLFHWNIIQPVVRGFALCLSRLMRINGPVGVAVVMNIFMGMTEAPLVVRPYLRTETRSGLFVILTAGMGTVAGSVMLIYAAFLDGIIPNALGHILTASLISAPAAIMIALMMIPAEDDSALSGNTDIQLPPGEGENAMAVVTRGTLEGVQLIINIVAMLIVLVALVTLVNMVIGTLPQFNDAPLTLQRILGWLMAPVAWLIGIPWHEATTAGALLGTKTVLNELIAYIELSNLPDEALSPRSRLIMTYALCGFANLSSVGIMIGAFTTMLPERRNDIFQLVPRAVVSGTLTTLLTGAMVGLVMT